MASTYAQPSDVAAFMTASQFPFDANSPYTATLVETYINMAEDEIDSIMKRSWRTKTSTDEECSIQWNTGTGFWVSNYYGYARTRYGPILSVTKVELLKGDGTYENITANEGRASDWYVDKATRTIYIRKFVTRPLQPVPLRVTYTYGEASASMPAYVKMAAILRTAWYILQSDDYTVLLPEGGDAIRNSEKAMEWDQKFKELIVPHRNGLVWK